MRESKKISKGLRAVLFILPISILLFAGIVFASEWVKTYGGQLVSMPDPSSRPQMVDT